MKYISKIQNNTYTVSEIGNTETQVFTQNELTEFVKSGNIVYGVNLNKGLFYSLIPLSDNAKKRSDLVYMGEKIADPKGKTAVITFEKAAAVSEKYKQADAAYIGVVAIYDKNSGLVTKHNDAIIFVSPNPFKETIVVCTKQDETFILKREDCCFHTGTQKISIPIEFACNNIGIAEYLNDTNTELIKNFLKDSDGNTIEIGVISATDRDLSEKVQGFLKTRGVIACWLKYKNKKYLLYKGTKKVTMLKAIADNFLYTEFDKNCNSKLSQALTEFYFRDTKGYFQVCLGSPRKVDWRHRAYRFRKPTNKGCAFYNSTRWGQYEILNIEQMEAFLSDNRPARVHNYIYDGVSYKNEDIVLFDGVDGVVEFSKAANADWAERVLENDNVQRAKANLLGLVQYNVNDKGELISCDMGRTKNPHIKIPDNVKKIRRRAITLPLNCTFEIKGNVTCLQECIQFSDKSRYGTLPDENTYIFEDLPFETAYRVISCLPRDAPAENYD
ncbi:MAG: hypothetical protein LBM93_06535 [Oscillospiraceae bacterium]|jgi:hypothetical protein|nr:hypothetical protein [Oscillospiraceae bacterium]